MKAGVGRWSRSAALLLLWGCGADTTDGGDDADPRDEIGPVPEPGPGADVLPRTGLWSYREEAIRNNTCGDWAITDGNTLFRVLTSEGASFTVEQDDGGDFVCAVVGDAFTCPARLRVERAVDGTNVTLRASVSIEGTVRSADALDGLQTVDMVCSGSQCAFAPRVLGIEFPCAYEVPFEARATGF